MIPCTAFTKDVSIGQQCHRPLAVVSCPLILPVNIKGYSSPTILFFCHHTGMVVVGQTPDIALQIGHRQRLGGEVTLIEMTALSLQELQLLAGFPPSAVTLNPM
ncbi:Uncharacterised protein [Aeromonas salmonicida]|nr:Uncharacterised protein [Aeromonas salmonicida]